MRLLAGGLSFEVLDRMKTPKHQPPNKGALEKHAEALNPELLLGLRVEGSGCRV